MAKLEEFLRTGHLGPVVLGMAPLDIIAVLGDAQGTSQRSNPLLLKYGSVEFTFWRSKSERVHQLRTIGISYRPVFEPLPEKLAFVDFSAQAQPNEADFRSFVERINYLPVNCVEGPTAKEYVFASGVQALCTSGMLDNLRLRQKNTEEPTRLKLSDEREPTQHQILQMLDEAARAMSAGAHRAALLIAWAGLEAALRRAAISVGAQGKIGLQPSILIRELFASGELNPAEHRALEQWRQLRTAAAHGLASAEVDAHTVDRITALSKELLSRFGEESLRRS